MKSIFDWLCLPAFRARPAMFLSRGNLEALEDWIHGYAEGCQDAGHPECLNTLNGVPFSLLRDFIAFQEKDRSVGGIAYILLESVNGQEKNAWEKFFSYLDAFLQLKITGTQIIELTEQMRRRYDGITNTFYLCSDRKKVPVKYEAVRLKKVQLSNGMCWVEEQLPNPLSMPPAADAPFFSPRFVAYGRYKILPEGEMDALLHKAFGDFEVNAEKEKGLR